MIPLYNHQKNIIREDRKWIGLFTGTGSAKTRTALELAEETIMVIMPKQQFLDETWPKNAAKFDIKKNIFCISKETFRRDWDKLPAYTTVIIDEVHNNLGVTAETRQHKGVQIPKTSQIFEATLMYLKKNPPKRVILCSATPASKPMSVWGLAKLMNVHWDFFKFRETFYIQRMIGRRAIWIPKKDEATKDRLAGLIQRFGYTGSLNDFVDVPEQTHKEVYVELTAEQKQALKYLNETEADALVRRSRQRTIENGVLYGKDVRVLPNGEEEMVNAVEIFPSQKIDYILERAEEFPKLLIFANYKAQIRQIAIALEKEGYKVSELTGETKNRGTLIQKAEESKAHIVVAQSAISAGYELPSFPCVIYASKSWQYVHYEQSLGRVLRINKLKKNLYIHLIVKGADEDCHKAIMSGADFQEKLSTL